MSLDTSKESNDISGQGLSEMLNQLGITTTFTLEGFIENINKYSNNVSGFSEDSKTNKTTIEICNNGKNLIHQIVSFNITELEKLKKGLNVNYCCNKPCSKKEHDELIKKIDNEIKYLKKAMKYL